MVAHCVPSPTPAGDGRSTVDAARAGNNDRRRTEQPDSPYAFRGNAHVRHVLRKAPLSIPAFTAALGMVDDEALLFSVEAKLCCVLEDGQPDQARAYAKTMSRLDRESKYA